MKWNKTAVDPSLVKDIAGRYKVDLLPAAIFARRQLTEPDSIKYFLEDDLRFVRNPFLFDEMQDAVERIQQAVGEGEKVMVYGDRDVDGIAGTVLMTETLANLGLDVAWGVPTGDDPYGITRAVVDRCLAGDVTLLIAVDCGTTNNDEIRYAADSGIDSIVIDHHNPQDEIPPAVAIINPKMPDSSYPFDGLCGCAIVAKVRFALGFSHSDFYNQPLCLLNVRPGNESLVLDAVKLENLVEVDRISENLMPDVLDVESSRLGSFLVGQQILVYDAASQESLLRNAFGNGVEINLIDVAPEIWKLFPSLSGKSLFRLRTASRLAIYGDGGASEIDVFASIFTTFVHKSIEQTVDDFESTLDLVSMGTLADMMPMLDENRILVKQGLRRMNRAPRAGLRSLLERQKLLEKTIVARDVGWSVSPVVNASGRMGEPEKAVELFLANDEKRREELADAVVALNAKRRDVGESAWVSVQEQAKTSLNAHGGRFVLVHNDSIHRGVTGIIAGRLARQYDAPSAVISLLADRAVGSIRTARGLVATDLLSQCSDILLDWGGHDAAAGFQFQPERLAEFESRLLDLVPTMKMENETEASVDIDAELPAGFLNPRLKDVVDLFAPFGQENPPLVFLARSLRIDEISIIGKEQQHVRMLFNAGKYRWPAVYWSGAHRVGGDIAKGSSVDIVFNFQMNFFQNKETPQLSILDVVLASQSPPQASS